MFLVLTVKATVQSLDTSISVLLFVIVYLFGWLKDITKNLGTDWSKTHEANKLLA